eukprot:TRINITY_DN68551_c0_g1_i1.p1 TRINITY_DN68551_c0_g1~~TRINITY_DN68551_c0_g1_i1.p1  ORF type:complete len:378 (+),score=79.30 TRINITY_DN68551_c0_g1_i1:173-1306(+)
MLWNRTGKKIKAINELLAVRSQEIDTAESQLLKLKQEVAACDEDTARISSEIEAQRRTQAENENDNARLSRQVQSAQADLADLQQQLADARAGAEKARKEKEVLLKELTETEDLVHAEHLAAEASAKAARQKAAQLQAEQEAERTRWQAMRLTHEELKQQLDTNVALCERARIQRDEAKVALNSTKDELWKFQQDHKRLQEEQQESEMQLAAQREQRAILEKEIASLTDQHQKVLQSHKELEIEHAARQRLLNTVTDDLNNKQASLQRQLKEFEERFEKARAQREKTMAEHDRSRESLGKFLPDYFQLQTDQSSRRREVEQVRREHEVLQWENHKVHRDLTSLAASYDPSFVPPQAMQQLSTPGMPSDMPAAATPHR